MSIEKNKNTQMAEFFPPSGKADREARSRAAKTVGVNPRYVSDAKRLKAEAPQVFEQVASGEKSLSQAKRETWELNKTPAPKEHSRCAFQLYY